MEVIKPPLLMPGDKVGLISPSNTVIPKAQQFHQSVVNFEESFEVEIQIAPHAMGKYWYSSGTTAERLDDFHQMVMDPEIKAIVLATGGNTAIELVEGLDYELVRENPKIITGISDATTLLTAITAKTGLITFLGLEFLKFGVEPMLYETEHLKKLWFDVREVVIEPNPSWRDFDHLPTSYREWVGVKPGKATGRLTGGNHYSYFQLMGTEYGPDFREAILLFETYKYPKKKIHQCLYQLRLRGVFEQIRGLVVGYCLDSDNATDESNRRPMADLLAEVTEGYDFPVMWIGEFGHNVENAVMPLGAKVTMDATACFFKIDEAVVL